MTKHLIKFAIATLSLLSIQVIAQIPVVDKRELDCTKRIASYREGLVFAESQTHSAESKAAITELDAAVKSHKTACEAENQIPALAATKRAIKAGDNAIKTN